MVGAHILWAVVGIVLVILFGAITAIVAGLPAYLLWQSTQHLLWPLVYGIPVGIVTFAVPVVFVGGLYLIFDASVWTQVYRQLGDMPRPAFDPDAPAPEAHPTERAAQSAPALTRPSTPPTPLTATHA